MKIYLFLKKCHKILTLVVVVLFIIQGYKAHLSLQRGGFPQRQHFVPFYLFYFLALSWLYITGILVAIKAISSFKEGKNLMGFGFLIIGLLFFIFSHYIVGYFFMFIYIMGT
ncbi:MAG: hypothetical protein LBI28_03455 [Treponema sp.]|jgi:hypothetical protein|nr:hypothetical protein [Treponema sp.]